MRDRRTILALFLAAAVAAKAQVQTPPGVPPYTAIHDPQYVAAGEATFLQDDDILLGVATGTVAKAFPAGDVSQHGVVFDRLPDGPISVAWCGVCNTGVVFRAEVNGRPLHLEFDSMVGANEVQKDQETGSRWQTASGEAISGPLKGTRLQVYPFVRTTWKEWRRRYPATLVLKPLPGYLERIPERSRRIKDLTRGVSQGTPKGALTRDDRLPARETVAGLEIGRETVAYPFAELRIARVVNDRVGGLPVVIVHQPSSDTTTAYEARVKGKALRFQAANVEASSLVDLETRSTWNAYGRCLEGPLRGTQLTQLIPIPEFWYAWSQFHPGTRVFATNTAKAATRGGNSVWETLTRARLPEDAEPVISVSRVSLAPAVPNPPRETGHTHQGPVSGYVLEGEVENWVDPEPLAIFRPGEFFAEPTGRLHRVLRNTRTSEPAALVTFQAGFRGQPAPLATLLLEERLTSTKSQEVSLFKLTLPPGARSDRHAHTGPGLVYVLEGKIEASGSAGNSVVYGADQTFLEPAGGAGLVFKNTSGRQPAKLLLYQVAQR